jgi:hypothetical protein
MLHIAPANLSYEAAMTDDDAWWHDEYDLMMEWNCDDKNLLSVLYVLFFQRSIYLDG